MPHTFRFESLHYVLCERCKTFQDRYDRAVTHSDTDTLHEGSCVQAYAQVITVIEGNLMTTM